MKCPACGDTDNMVMDSRPVDDGAMIRRRRHCAACKHRWTTFEGQAAPRQATALALLERRLIAATRAAIAEQMRIMDDDETEEAGRTPTLEVEPRAGRTIEDPRRVGSISVRDRENYRAE